MLDRGCGRGDRRCPGNVGLNRRFPTLLFDGRVNDFEPILVEDLLPLLLGRA